MKGKVLVIEDDEDWQELLREYLEDAGFHVDIVNNLEDALLMVRQSRFHFITIDMNLDEKTDDAENFEGWFILDVIKKLRINDITPTMVITGYGQEYKELKNAKKLDSVFFIEKGSLERDELVSTIENVIKRIDLRFKNDYRGD